MNTEATYASKFAAQRAANRAGYMMDQCAFIPLIDGAKRRWSFQPKTNGASTEAAAAPMEARVNQKIKALADHLAETPAKAKPKKKGRPAKADSKTEILRRLITRDGGATMADMLEATKGGHHDWDKATVKSYIAWFQKKGMSITLVGDTYVSP